MLSMRSTARTVESDEGMTIVEIVVASTILFIALTALVPLLFTTTKMAQQTKAKTVALNAMNSYVEQARAITYDDLGVDGTSIPGDLASESVLSLEGFSVVIKPTVEWVDDPNMLGTQDYKRLIVDASVSSSSMATMTYTMTTFVWGAPYEQETAALPEVAFTTNSPAADAVVSGVSVIVGGRAETDLTAGFISSMVLKVDASYLPNSLNPPDFASWAPMTTPYEQSFYWDTTAQYLVVDSETGDPILDAEGQQQYLAFSPDGIRVLKVEAWDNLSGHSYVTRRVLVDNYAPLTPGAPTGACSTSTNADVTWPTAMDGTEGAALYNLIVYKQPTSSADDSAWPQANAVQVSTTSSSMTVLPFSRYYAVVQAQSPLAHKSDWSAASAKFVSRPELSGTTLQKVTKSSSKYKITTTVVLDVTNPNFAVSGTVLYDVWRSTDLATLGTGSAYMSNVAFDSGTWTDTIVDSTSYSKNSTTPTYYYKVKASFTPYGGTSTESWTNTGSVPGLTVSAATTVNGTVTQTW